MSKPLVEYVSETVWKILLTLIVLAIVVLSIIGAINAHNNYVEPVYSPDDDVYWYYEYYYPQERPGR
jgi:ABC-type glycerol-3-phosphate transport system permease component